MVFEYYNPDSDSNCVVRSLAKIIGFSCEKIKKGLTDLANDLEYDNYSEIEVFERYMLMNNIEKINLEYSDKKIRDLKLGKGKYMIFCYDKEEWYHLVAIIDNVIYDKKEEVLDLYPINIYKMNDFIM